MARSRSRWALILKTVLATALAVLLVANFALGDKHIDAEIPTLYAGGAGGASSSFTSA